MNLSAVIRHKTNPDHVQRIVREWRANPLVDDYVVLSDAAKPPRLWGDVTQIATSSLQGARGRLLAGLLAKNQALLIQDDNLLLPPETVRRLFNAWKLMPDSLHGLFGRQPKPDGSYAKLVNRRDAKVDVVLGRAMVVSRNTLARYFVHEEEFTCLSAAPPASYGEEIVLSFIAQAYSGRLNEVYELPYKELDPLQAGDEQAFGKPEFHTRVMRAARHWCETFSLKRRA